MGNVYQITSAFRSSSVPLKKISKDEYLDLRDGVIYEYKHIANRSESKDSIRNTIKHICELINCNIVIPGNCLWGTLTYRENMTDTEKLYSDFKSFWLRLRRYLHKYCFSLPEYISVIEPQGRGAWHIHFFLIWSDKAPFIPNAELARLWSHGFVKINAMNNCDNVGAYFSAYLADRPLDDFEIVPVGFNIVSKEYLDENGQKVCKKIVKGGRIALYPAGMHIIRHSRGIKYPEIEYMPYAIAKEKIGSAKPTFSCSVNVVGDDGSVYNSLTYENYIRV